MRPGAEGNESWSHQALESQEVACRSHTWDQSHLAFSNKYHGIQKPEVVGRVATVLDLLEERAPLPPSRRGHLWKIGGSQFAKAKRADLGLLVVDFKVGFC